MVFSHAFCLLLGACNEINTTLDYNRSTAAAAAAAAEAGVSAFEL
jgi:hypothetical protein